MAKCKCKQTTSSTDRHQLNGIRENTLIQRQFTASTKMNKMSVTVGLAAKCPSPHPSIKGTRTVASTSNTDRQQSKEQLNCNSSSFRRKQRPTLSDNTSPDEEDDHIANGHHIAILSDDNDGDNLGDDEENNDTDYETDNSSESDNNLENYLKITIPSDCRLKQSITPTNSPQSQSIQHSPHHAISVLSSILAKYETSGYIEQHHRKRDEFIWNRQINSERTSPRIMRQNNVADVTVKHSSRRNNCYCCVQSSSSASSTKNTKKLYHQHTTTNHYMAANLKSRTLSLPQCSFTDDFDTTKLTTMCSDINCRCIHVQSAIKTKNTERSNKTDVQCNCSSLKLSTNVSDVLETTC